MGWASLSINIRAANERRQLLIKGVGRGTFARVITLAGSLFVIFTLFGMVGDAMPGGKDMKRISNDDDLIKKGLTSTVMFLQVFRKACHALLMASTFTAIVNAGIWLRGLRKMFKLFADEIHAVASSSDKVDLEAGASAGGGGETRIVDGKDDFVEPSFASAQIAAQNTVKHSFEKIWDLSEAVNEIFQLPLSAMFVMLLTGIVGAWHEAITEGKEGSAGFGSFLLVIGVTMLFWVSTAGDAYWKARTKLLRPDISLGLATAIGREEAGIFARSLERTQLGFDIVSVTITTHKVLYVVFSLLIFAAYIIPKSTTYNV